MATNKRLIFGGVDGTGDFFDRTYEPTFDNSHVNILHQFWNEGPSHYRRGPWWVGDWTYVEANRIYSRVKADWVAGAGAIFLAGYSRGGAAVIEIAKWLKQDGIPVECLILFDPVDRSRVIGEGPYGWRDSPIVDTVSNVIYAQRQTITKSRESFGNCGKKYQDRSKTKLVFNSFFCTHGGMGGTPWSEPKVGFIDEGFPDFGTQVTVAQDKLGSEKVQRWVYERLFEIVDACKQRLDKEGTVSANPGFQTPTQGAIGITPVNGQRIHIVQPGDWLSKIALKYYGDAMKYTVIHKANLGVIGPNPDIIKPGQRLVIP